MVVTFTPWHGNRVKRALARLSWRLVTKTVHVTQEDIENGEPGSSQECPIALAVRRLFPDAKMIMVGKLGITVYHGDVREEWEPDDRGFEFLRSPMAEFVGNFDTFKDVQPLSITLHLKSRLPMTL